MKKLRLKKWVKELLVVSIIFIIGLVAVFIMVERAEQINKGVQYEEIN